MRDAPLRSTFVIALIAGACLVRADEPAVVATYDPRAVAIAFQGSDFYRDDLFRLMDEMQAAGAANSDHRVKAAQARTEDLLNEVEGMALGTRPVDPLLARIKDSLPAIQSGAGASALVSTFDDTALSGRQQVDVTESLIDAFHPRAEDRARALAVRAVPRPAKGATPPRASLESRRLDEPMYAGATPRPHERINDEWFIDRVSKQFGGRQAASRTWVDQGFRLYQGDDNARAMARFNQAWLLDPDYPDVYWGFASVLNDARRYCDAASLIDKTLGYGKHGQGIEADAGRIHSLCGFQQAEPRKSEERAKGTSYFEQALKLDENLSYVYVKWCRTLEEMGESKAALAVAERGVAAGVKLPKDMLRDLRREAGGR